MHNVHFLLLVAVKGAHSIYAQYAHAYLSVLYYHPLLLPSYCNCPVYCESCAESFFQGQLRRMPRPALVSFPGEGLCGTWERDQPGAARPQPMPCPAGRPRPYNIISRDRTRGLSRVRLCHCTNYTVYSCQPGQGS